MTQLFNELVELLEAIEKGGDLPPMGPAHQRLVELDEEDGQATSSLSSQTGHIKRSLASDKT